jgi:hypothetical protein
MKRRLFAGVCLGAALWGAANGCSSSPYTDPLADTRPQIDIKTSNKEIVEGEVTTLTLKSRNTLGRDAEIEWSTTGGDLDTSENGQTARVRFEQPGMYTVTARLLVNDVEMDREMVTINVRPLR